MIELIPAIDIIGGECVRLTRGDYSQKKTYSKNPAEVAMEFERLGFKRLHVVDLDGAKSKHIVNSECLHDISSSTSLRIDFGGGIKTLHDMDLAFDNGAEFATIGSISYTDPESFVVWINRYGAERIILGADVSNGKIAINGWLDNTDADLFEFLQFYIDKGIRNVLCTDIAKDGALKGPSLALYKEIMSKFPELHLIASGGVASTEDIISLEKAGIPAVVFGKAYYEGLINVERLKMFM